MEYISTRSADTTEAAAFCDSSDAIIKGLAADGGLFVPRDFPAPYTDAEKLNKLSGLDYKSLAYEIMRHFLDDFTETELKSCIEQAYDDKFDDALIAPLVKTGGAYFLELFHGKTLAFKDMALSILPYLMKTAVRKKNIDKRIVILAATSGDTGKAAMEGFKDVDGISVVVFYPKNGVSAVQELQMTTQEGKNVKAVAIEGNFDDAQSGVKSIFSDKGLEAEFEKSGIILSSANSINIGRLIPQVVYYFYGYFQLASGGEISPGDTINVCVPTGNFGNILAAYYAKRMGLPIGRLICASNKNKVLYDFFETGVYNVKRELFITNSPSMDIIVSSNLERLLYHIGGASTAEIMEGLKNNGKYEFDKSKLDKEGFTGEYATEKESLEAIAGLYDDTGYIMDTHTAVAYSGYERYKSQSGDAARTIITSTASPYKFTKSVMDAIGEYSTGKSDFDLIKDLAKLLAEEVPEQIRDLDKKPVLHNYCCKKEDIKAFVQNLDLGV